MIPFGKNYFYHEGKVYKEVLPDKSRKTPRWRLTDKTGNQHWMTLKQIETIVKKKQSMV